VFAGGIADKLGNRYEAKWLVRQFLDVLAGRAEWVQFEGIGREFQGFEFAVSESGLIRWHQTKVSNRNGNWTISALSDQGVLAAFRKRLEASEHDHCVFVSQEPAAKIAALEANRPLARRRSRR